MKTSMVRLEKATFGEDYYVRVSSQGYAWFLAFVGPEEAAKTLYQAYLQVGYKAVV